MGVLVLLLLCCSLSARVNGQITKWFSKCPEAPGKADFDLSKYLGRWYEIEKYPNWFEWGSCCGAEYTLAADGGLAVNNTEILKSGKVNVAIAEGRQDPSSNMASHLQVRFSRWQPWDQYLVLDTDYETFSAVYTCKNLLVARLEFLWILSRHRTIPAETHKSLYKLFDGYGIRTSPLEKTNQDPKLCAALP